MSKNSKMAVCKHLNPSIWSGYSYYCNQKHCFCVAENRILSNTCYHYDLSYKTCKNYNPIKVGEIINE